MTIFLQFDKDYRAPIETGKWTLDRALGGNGQAIAMYLAHAMGKRAAACCVTIVQAEKLASDFNKAGITAEVISGQHSPRERGEIVHRWVSGETRVLCGSAMLHNLPCRAEAVLLMRPTASRTLYNREVAIGAKRGGAGVLIDLVGNIARHGFPREHYDMFFTPPAPPDLRPTGPSIAELINAGHLSRTPEQQQAFVLAVLHARQFLDALCPGPRRYCQDDGMGELVMLSADARRSARYYATSGDVH